MTATQNEAPALPAGAQPLPDGQWVVLRSHQNLMGGDVIDVRAKTVSGQGYVAAANSQYIALGELLVENWSFADLPLPATEAMQRRLPAAALVKLHQLLKPAYDLINGISVAPVFDEKTMDDPASPTAGSSE